jgi:hypothetical protein
MVRFRVTVNSQASIYLPGPVREELGSRRLQLLGDAKAVIIYPEGTDLQEVLRSVEILTLDLRHRCELEKPRSDDERARRDRN